MGSCYQIKSGNDCITYKANYDTEPVNPVAQDVKDEDMEKNVQKLVTLTAHLKKNDTFPRITVSFNKEYCNGLTKVMVDNYKKEINNAQLPKMYAVKQKTKEMTTDTKETKSKALENMIEAAGTTSSSPNSSTSVPRFGIH